MVLTFQQTNSEMACAFELDYSQQLSLQHVMDAVSDSPPNTLCPAVKVAL
jgi:hypothetical protein